MYVRFSHIFACTLTILLTYASAGIAEVKPEDQKFLSKIQTDTIRYFLEKTEPRTGLVLDASRSGSPASIAATGFGMVSTALAGDHGIISYREAHDRILKTLDTLERDFTHKNGFFYHFLDPKSARRAWDSEASSIDTALLLAGALVASTYFQGTEIPNRVNQIYKRVLWPWMLNGTKNFCHGWKPREGFLPYYWDMYSEHLILQVLAQGSETHAVPADVWDAWERAKDTYNGEEIVYSYTGSLFTYQYSQAFVDFRKLRDHGINYFENSERATIANFQFSESESSYYKTYEGAWGLSASLGPTGYKAYGAPPGLALHDGTVAIHAILGSIVFTPAKSISTIRQLFENYEDELYGPYGFRDAFNLDMHWWATEYIGIDQGIIVLMIENYLSNGEIWNRFMSLPAVKRWLSRTSVEVLS